MKTGFFFSCAAGLLALASCGGNQSVSFSNYEFANTIGYNDNGGPSISIKISVPYVDGNDAFASAFNADVCSFLFNADNIQAVDQAASMAVNKRIEEFRSDTRARMEIDPDMHFDYEYYVSAKAENRADAGIVNLLTTEYSYLGGAHGSTLCSCRNYDIKDGHLIKLEDILPAGSEKNMIEQLKQALLKQTGCPSWDKLDDYEYFSDIEMFIPEHFIIGPDSISFIFNQYEIAPYSTGITTLTVSRP